MLASLSSLQLGAACASLQFGALGAGGVSALRLGIAAVVMLVLVRPRPLGWTRARWAVSIQLGVCLALMNITFYEAVARLPLGIAIAVQFSGPLAVAAATTRRWTDAVPVLGAAAGIGIFGLQSWGGQASLDSLGLLIALVAGAFWAAYIVTASRAARLHAGLDGLAVASVVAGALALPWGVSVAGDRLLDPTALLVGLGIALLASVVPYVCEITALRVISGREFSIMVALEPAVGAVVGLLVLRQGLSVTQSIAIALVVVAAVTIARAGPTTRVAR